MLRLAKVLTDGKGVTARWGLKEAGVQSCEPSLPWTRSGEQKRHIKLSLWVRQHLSTCERTGRQHNKALGSGDTVNGAVAQRKFTLLNRVPFGKFNGVNVLIRGGLPFARVYLSAGEITGRATGIQRPRRLSDRLSPRDEIRNKGSSLGIGDVL